MWLAKSTAEIVEQKHFLKRNNGKMFNLIIQRSQSHLLYANPLTLCKNMKRILHLNAYRWLWRYKNTVPLSSIFRPLYWSHYPTNKFKCIKSCSYYQQKNWSDHNSFLKNKNRKQTKEPQKVFYSLVPILKYSAFNNFSRAICTNFQV